MGDVTPPSVIQPTTAGGHLKAGILGLSDSAADMANKHENHFVGGGLPPIDPFANPTRFFPSLFNAILATALFRCWNLILLFGGWATCVCVISAKVHNLGIQPTLLTVFGTILGFVISYRTSSSFERYNEGRRLWSTIVLASRTFSRTVWFHIPDTPSTATPETAAEARARNLIEKRTAINLVEAFSVAVKHYLRGEEGIYYEDLYHLVKFLPAYSLPADLAPASNPPKWGAFDVWPLSLLVKVLTQKGKSVSGKKAAKERAKQHVISHNVPLEITLYLSSYISALQQRKVVDVPTINTLLLGLNQLVDSLSGLERILTTPIPFSYGVHLWTVCLLYVFFLPFQLWPVLKWVTIPATSIAVRLIHFHGSQLCLTYFVQAFLFFGFIVAGEEIENPFDPFGYDKNDLNLDHFCRNIIHAELMAITSVPVPDPSQWAFAKDNDCVFGTQACREYALGLHMDRCCGFLEVCVRSINYPAVDATNRLLKRETVVAQHVLGASMWWEVIWDTCKMPRLDDYESGPRPYHGRSISIRLYQRSDSSSRYRPEKEIHSYHRCRLIHASMGTFLKCGT
ncbi:unnamed protein product [Rhizoctonia solani]|uniref:Uncharacterized protein n=1 Tax=Rhizoctonia solani TaxID=456999 RepID=A0A8H3HG00_9AGAM|nr:unnamed protein product [Rhizoctonia solani]